MFEIHLLHRWPVMHRGYPLLLTHFPVKGISTVCMIRATQTVSYFIPYSPFIEQHHMLCNVRSCPYVLERERERLSSYSTLSC